MSKLILIDGNSLLFKAYYATAPFDGDTSKIMRSKNGCPTNAIYALANIAIKILETEHPDYALVAFDTNKPTFRHEEYKDYKAGRRPAPEELKAQFEPAREMLRKFGFFVSEIEGYEADDIIGTVSRIGSENHMEVKIFSSDNDLLQLVDDNVTVCQTKKGVSDLHVMTPASLREEWGVEPLQIIDFKGLTGDKSDNIPGVPGVGPKTAVKLINEYGSVEKILEAPLTGKVGETILANKESALFSKKLATINRFVPISYGIDELKYNGFDYLELSSFVVSFDMYSIEKKIPKPIVDEEVKFEIVSKIPDTFYSNDCSIICESITDQYHNCPIVGFGLSNENGTYFITVTDIVNDTELIKYLRDKNVKKYGYDNKKIIVALNRLGIQINGLEFDILLACYLLQSTLNDDPCLIFSFLNRKVAVRNEVYKRGIYEISNVAEYACSQAKYTYILRKDVLAKLKKDNLLDLFNNIEMPLSSILAKMEIEGVCVDKPLLQKMADDVSSKIKELEQNIYEIAGKKFNINSTVQLAEVLFDELNLPANKKRSTAQNELVFLTSFHPIAAYILEYRKYQKLFSTYLEGLQAYIQNDGKIHTIYNQALTQTRRLSSRDPNLQNITNRTEEGREVRKAFISSKGHKLVSFDYSQIELRVLCSAADCKPMIDAFNSDEDVHAQTASKIFKCPIEQVSKDMRRRAKTVNFGIVYGMGDFGLAEELGISFKEAKEFIANYFETYPEIKEYFAKSVEKAKQDGFTKTYYGRIRYINELNSSNHFERENGKRIAMNAPIQGTAADIMKIAMIKVANKLKEVKSNAKMILQIHDEVVFDVPDEEVETIIPIIKHELEDFDNLKVKLVAEYNVGESWYK